MKLAFAPFASLLLALLLAAPLSVDADVGCKCRRTMKGREHLHPKTNPSAALPTLSLAEEEEKKAFPSHFDWCERGVCVPSWNQHIPQYCGSCYVHGALSSAQDRIKILNMKRGYSGADVMLGRQSFLNCAPGHGFSAGCDGGEAADVYEFMTRYGLPDESCLPYNATDHTKFQQTNGTCPPEGYCMNCMYTPDSPTKPLCFPVTKVVRYRAKRYGHIVGEHAMMKELLKGPITCGIACSDGFTYGYKAGIYEDKTGFMDIDHDVEVVGWGEEDGVKYWHVRNSWGTYWGMNGFFKIVRGINNLGIEADCAFVDPDIAEEELVWEEKPIYGGSIFGIVPFAKNAEERHPLDDTTDVTTADTPSSPAVAIEAAAVMHPEAGTSSGILGALFYFVAGCVCTTLIALVAMKARVRRYVYRPIA
ncbi:hypothetical protein P43SY_003345 [Pythium insidiosum]|uniref:Peptidase C1A papain C-terminal domain-containing protein n=1 Tax=Pythium insidiosum TaxID=114742 RepID=A0AAD5Q5D1_PYTIN|nr:hypothetical protein P43SY_003345 [Pythium insidiosum]